MFSILQKGLFSQVGPPFYGKQDVGVSPGGAMDCFSHETGNIMLGNEAAAPALEMIIAPVMRFKEDCYFILTGAKHRDVHLKGLENIMIQHGKVYKAIAGSILEFGKKEYGFRTYLCYVPARECHFAKPEGRVRGDFSKITSWQDSKGVIRVIEGPEFNYLNDPGFFLGNSWKVSSRLNSMGMRLENSSAGLSVTMNKAMVSEAVSDGTIQFTPDGPIILLKHRQTIGGYPRVFNVISADVDLLGQYLPGQLIHFKKVSMEGALNALARKHMDIQRIHMRYPQRSTQFSTPLKGKQRIKKIWSE